MQRTVPVFALAKDSQEVNAVVLSATAPKPARFIKCHENVKIFFFVCKNHFFLVFNHTIDTKLDIVCLNINVHLVTYIKPEK